MPVFEMAGPPGIGKTTVYLGLLGRHGQRHGCSPLPVNAIVRRLSLTAVSVPTVLRFRGVLWLSLRDSVGRGRGLRWALSHTFGILVLLRRMLLRDMQAERRARRLGSWVVVDEGYVQRAMSVAMRLSPAAQDDVVERMHRAAPRGRHVLIMSGPLHLVIGRTMARGTMPPGVRHWMTDRRSSLEEAYAHMADLLSRALASDRLHCSTIEVAADDTLPSVIGKTEQALGVHGNGP